MSYEYQGPPVAFPGQKPPTSFGVPPGTPSAPPNTPPNSQAPPSYVMPQPYSPYPNSYTSQPLPYLNMSGQSIHQSSMPQPSLAYSAQNFSTSQSTYGAQAFPSQQQIYSLPQPQNQLYPSQSQQPYSSQSLHHSYPVSQVQQSQTYNHLQPQQNPYPLQGFPSQQSSIISQNPAYAPSGSGSYPNLNSLEKSDPTIPIHSSGSSPYPSRGYSGGRASSGNFSYGGSISQMAPAPRMTQVSTKFSPTVIPFPNLDSRVDAEVLRKAMKGFGTDEKSIIQIIANRTNLQRQEIAIQFKTLYGKDLIRQLDVETSGNFNNLLIAMMTPLPQFYAKELYDAMRGIGTEESVLIEVLCTLSNHEIQEIKHSYETMYRKSLEDDIRNDTSGNFKRFLVSLSCGNRDETFQVNNAEAINDAKRLLQAGELRFGTDESTFNAILVQRNVAQLKQIFTEYYNITGHNIETAIDNEFSGNIKIGLLSIVKCIKNQASFFAEQLYKSMKGMGTNDRSLIRIIITRSEIDMGEIKQAFKYQYGQSLENFISDDCSGHYKKCLLTLIS
ncbi:PREDICTED: annexin B9-like [Ceratosolen solmsi marchali]|uniref:Annexin n=1 Tax=Ceratosolen solmsi marchali TaxID=326594 RepID=A0AAJ6YFP8_9HYME|nr:PREDICTED: annexin B9-like [Ceratosolen solmsi marchali]